MSDVFLSYSRSDRPHAEAIAKELRELGVEVWWDHDLAGGDDFRREITERLERVSAAVVLWSSRSIESRWVINEASAASEKKLLIPISIDRSTPPIDFRSFHTIDFAAWVPGDRLPESFLKAVGDRIGRDLKYGTPAQERDGIVRVARQVTQAWWFDFEAMLFFLIGQAIACFLCNVSIVSAISKAPPELAGGPFGYIMAGYGLSLLIGLLVSALYMRPLLESRRLNVALPLFLAGTLLSLGAHALADRFANLPSLPMIQVISPATLLLLLVTTIANKALRKA